MPRINTNSTNKLEASMGGPPTHITYSWNWWLAFVIDMQRSVGRTTLGTDGREYKEPDR